MFVGVGLWEKSGKLEWKNLGFGEKTFLVYFVIYITLFYYFVVFEKEFWDFDEIVLLYYNEIMRLKKIKTLIRIDNNSNFAILQQFKNPEKNS